MAREVERIYLSSHLKRTFVSGAMHPLGTTNPHVTSTSFDEVIGKLARDSFLSDIAVTFSLQNVRLDLHTGFVFEPMCMSRCGSYLPAQHYNHVELTLFPINIENIHWVIAIARLHTTDGRVRVALYDPMITPNTKAPWSSFRSRSVCRLFGVGMSETSRE
uniref:AlNc14C45G3695 protein n=1 Tax=Albugo laibachii Nc14 TaxID=890382 RepID=F0WAG9_9STRA|nr:AlNc14C45G3695 [Albugo laibachii Nc14]|eukprot:CCA18140.1 AlNc14C45G3695 [Albugo laibachii Nc14]